MTYQPDPRNHSQDQAGLWCHDDNRYCSEADPCTCCRPAADTTAKPPKKA